MMSREGIVAWRVTGNVSHRDTRALLVSWPFALAASLLVTLVLVGRSSGIVPVITKYSYTYSIKILRQEKIIRDHGAEPRHPL
jgi:hypothetical protein